MSKWTSQLGIVFTPSDKIHCTFYGDRRNDLAYNLAKLLNYIGADENSSTFWGDKAEPPRLNPAACICGSKHCL